MALAVAEPDVHFLQVTAAVVTGDATEIDTEKSLAVEDRQFVMRVQLLDHSEIFAIVRLRFALHVLAGDQVGGCYHVITFRRGSDDVAYSVVVGTVDAKVLLHPVVEEVLPAAHL